MDLPARTHRYPRLSSKDSGTTCEKRTSCSPRTCPRLTPSWCTCSSARRSSRWTRWPASVRGSSGGGSPRARVRRRPPASGSPAAWGCWPGTWPASCPPPRCSRACGAPWCRIWHRPPGSSSWRSSRASCFLTRFTSYGTTAFTGELRYSDPLPSGD